MLALRTPFVLASQSPRRRHLLHGLGLSFDVLPSDIEEQLPDGLGPGEAASQVALDKAVAVGGTRRDALTLGADTIVVLDDEILGKPADADEAARTLRRLSGRTHAVHTGVALVHPATGRHVRASERTDVTFAKLTEAEVDAYVQTGSPLDKAGAYGIQDDLGALFVSRIEGDYYNVVGLPLHRLYRLLREHFADLLSDASVARR